MLKLSCVEFALAVSGIMLGTVFICVVSGISEGAVCPLQTRSSPARRAIVVVACDESLVGVIRDGYTDRSPQADVSLSSESGPFGVLSGRVSSVGTADPPAVARCDDNFGFAVFSQKNRMPRWRTLRIPADTIAQAHKIATGAPEAGSALPHDSVTQDVAICAGCPQRCAQSCGVGLGVCSNSDPRGAHVA
jgi:hypothetical protein